MNSLTAIVLSTYIACLFISSIYGVPVPKPVKGETQENLENMLPDVSYKQYLSEVISTLENDKNFAEKIRSINNTEGVSSQLEFASHSVRSRLDEIKRQEVERLNELEKMLRARMAAKAAPGSDSVRWLQANPELTHLDPGTIKRAHLDHENSHSFEIADLEKLVRQVTRDIEQVDAAREEEYKRYEMAKEHSKRARLHRIRDRRKREAAEQQLKAEQEKHRQHERVHQPGSRQQLKEVWEKTDHMDADSFNSKAFFMMHDINGDGHLDIGEIEALFWKELDKVYGRDDDRTVDRVERQHELDRMRKSLLKQVDTNHDMMISWAEFDTWHNSQAAKTDNEWKTTEELDNAKPYSEEELKRFEEQYALEHPNEAADVSGPELAL